MRSYTWDARRWCIRVITGRDSLSITSNGIKSCRAKGVNSSMAIKWQISDDLAEFIQSGLPMTVATRDGELQAYGASAWAALVDDDRTHMTVFLYEKVAAAMLANLEMHPEIAVVIDHPLDHRACQVKGYLVASRRARPAERREVERQRDGFLSALETIGIPRTVMLGWRFWPCVALRFRVTQIFEQTPGPGAGEPLR